MRVRNPLPQFDIHTTRAQLQIKSPKLELKVDREPARMQVHRTRPRMKVNWAKVRAQSGKNRAAGAKAGGFAGKRRTAGAFRAAAGAQCRAETGKAGRQRRGNGGFRRDFTGKTAGR